MFDNVISLLRTLGDIAIPCVTAWIAFMTWKQGQKQKLQIVKQDEIHSQINGMQDKLIKAEKSESEQIGNKQGRDELKQEQKEEKKSL